MEEKTSLEKILTISKKSLTKKLIWGIAILILILVVLTLILKTSQPKVIYRTGKVSKGDLVVKVNATGTLKPLNQVEVGSEISGTIRSIEVDYNYKVKKGQVLARLDTTRIESDLLQAQAQLEAQKANLQKVQAELALAEGKLKRMLEAYERSGGQTPSQLEIEMQRAEVQQLQAELLRSQALVEEAKALIKLKESDLQKAIIRSPIDGIVLARHVEVGQTIVSSLQSPTLFTLAENLRQMELILDVDEADIAQVQVGQKAKFTVDAYPEREFEAKVKEVRFYPKTSQGVVTYEVVLEVPNPELLLRPGMTATAEIIVKELKDVLLVPNQALRFDPTRIYKKEKRGFLSLFMPAFPRRMPQIPPLEKKVWILREGKPIPIPVKTGPSDGQFTQVVSDVLKPGMEVVIGMEEK